MYSQNRGGECGMNKVLLGGFGWVSLPQRRELVGRHHYMGVE